MLNCSEVAFGSSITGSHHTAGSLKMDSPLLFLVNAFVRMNLGRSILHFPFRATPLSLHASDRFPALLDAHRV